MEEFSRVTRPVQAAERYYSRLSKFYDVLASSEKRYIRQGLDLLDPCPGETILEIGFGTGYAQEYIARKIKGGISIGLDLSVGMGDVTRKRLVRAGLLDQVGLIRSDTLPIPLQTKAIDGLFISFTLELFDTPLITEVLKECRRVLKPGGRLVIVCLSKDRPLGLTGRIYENIHQKFPGLTDCRPIPVIHLVERTGMKIKSSVSTSMWGLPVAIVLVE